MWPFGKKLRTLEIHMRSGNRIIINSVIDYTIKAGSDGVSSIQLNQKHRRRRRLLSTIDLSQIEAVVEIH